jgi:hypothetical protein
MKKNIYNMQLHDEIKVARCLWVIRVAGGWIYSLIDNNENTINTFVPFNNEFQDSSNTVGVLK